MAESALPLAGCAILVTRPAEQAEGLAAGILRSGGTPILFPTLAIMPPHDPKALSHSIARLRDFDLIIFVSPTAVERAWPFILERHGDWPEGFLIAAVGQGSVRALRGFGIRQILAPEKEADSEHLLAMPELQDVRGRRVLVVRGEGGRELLAETLRRRGAQVEYAECYRRARPDVDAAPLLRLWRQNGIHAVTITSTEILANLVELLGAVGLELLRTTPVFVLHERIAESARALGIVTVITTPPGEEGLIAGLTEWFARHHE